LPDPVHPFTVSFGTFASGETVNIRGFPRCVYRVGTRVAIHTSVSAPSVNQILFCVVSEFYVNTFPCSNNSGACLALGQRICLKIFHVRGSASCRGLYTQLNAQFVLLKKRVHAAAGGTSG
jgi:hypothetical protein